MVCIFFVGWAGIDTDCRGLGVLFVVIFFFLGELVG